MNFSFEHDATLAGRRAGASRLVRLRPAQSDEARASASRGDVMLVTTPQQRPLLSAQQLIDYLPLRRPSFASLPRGTIRGAARHRISRGLRRRTGIRGVADLIDAKARPARRSANHVRWRHATQRRDVAHFDHVAIRDWVPRDCPAVDGAGILLPESAAAVCKPDDDQCARQPLCVSCS